MQYQNSLLMNNKQQTLQQHLVEMRQRLTYIIIYFLLSFIFCYIFIEPIYNFLLEPLSQIYGSNSDKRMIYTGLAEAFITYLRLSFLSAIFLTLPFLLIQFYLFLAPGLYQKEKKLLLSLLTMSPLLFLFGAILIYYFVFPLAFKFFVSFEAIGNAGNMAIELEARISEYLNLVVKLIFAFGLAFQLPILLIILVKIDFLSIASLKTKRKYWILFIFILAAILTPPDIFSQIFLALPMILLYEVAIIICVIINKDKNSNGK